MAASSLSHAHHSQNSDLLKISSPPHIKTEDENSSQNEEKNELFQNNGPNNNFELKFSVKSEDKLEASQSLNNHSQSENEHYFNNIESPYANNSINQSINSIISSNSNLIKEENEDLTKAENDAFGAALLNLPPPHFSYHKYSPNVQQNLNYAPNYEPTLQFTALKTHNFNDLKPKEVPPAEILDLDSNRVHVYTLNQNQPIHQPEIGNFYRPYLLPSNSWSEFGHNGDKNQNLGQFYGNIPPNQEPLPMYESLPINNDNLNYSWANANEQIVGMTNLTNPPPNNINYLNQPIELSSQNGQNSQSSQNFSSNEGMYGGNSNGPQISVQNEFFGPNSSSNGHLDVFEGPTPKKMKKNENVEKTVKKNGGDDVNFVRIKSQGGECRRPKSHHCPLCNKWFTSSGHLKRHYGTTLHKNSLRMSGEDPEAFLQQMERKKQMNKKTKGTNGPSGTNTSKALKKFIASNLGPENNTTGLSATNKPTNSIGENNGSTSIIKSALEGSLGGMNYGAQPTSTSSQNFLPQPYMLPQSPHNFAPSFSPSHFTPYLNNPLSSNNLNPSTSNLTPNSTLTSNPNINLNLMPSNLNLNVNSNLHLNLVPSNLQLVENGGNIYEGNFSLPPPPHLSNFEIPPHYEQPFPISNFIHSASDESYFRGKEERDENSEVKVEKNEEMEIENGDENQRHDEVDEEIHLNSESPEVECSSSTSSSPSGPDEIELSSKENDELLTPKTQNSSLNATHTSNSTKNSSDLPNVIHCPDCSKTFNRACYFTQHSNSCHGDGKRFKCSICGKKFNKEEDLEEHIKKHGSNKPYKCDLCPKEFNHKTDLRRHICLHTGEKPFPCSVCGKGFIRKDHMTKHSETHRKNKTTSAKTE